MTENTLKKIYLVYPETDEDIGEVEGMFDEDGNLLGTWACNDGNWRNEYFNGFMKKLGFDVVYAEDEMLSKCTEILVNHWIGE